MGLDLLHRLLDGFACLLVYHLFQQLGGAVLHSGVGGLQHGVRLGVGHVVQRGVNHRLAVQLLRRVGAHQNGDLLAVLTAAYADAHHRLALLQILGQPRSGVLGQHARIYRGEVHLHPLGRLHRVLLLLDGVLLSRLFDRGFRLGGGLQHGIFLLGFLLQQLLELVQFAAAAGFGHLGLARDGLKQRQADAVCLFHVHYTSLTLRYLFPNGASAELDAVSPKPRGRPCLIPATRRCRPGSGRS